MAADDVLAQAIDGIADGGVVNWRMLQGLARSDDERAELKWLQVLGDVANVHRSSHQEEIVEPSGATQAAITTDVGAAQESWGRYRLVRKLGAGSFGSVYCAWDPQLERNIAIKILHAHVADERLRQRLLREGRALAKVQHSNVVQVFGIEAHGSRVGLCMELVSGETLGALLRLRGLLSHGEATVVGEDVCRALAAVHAAGYVHRDVKAQNVMRDKAGKIVLMDFGTGHDTEGGARRPRDVVGTPVYMAPEVLDGEPASVQSDVYAVGVLLYHLVTGHYPVEGGTVLDLIDAHKAGRRRPLLERRPDLPMPFVQVVSRALASNPAERWPSSGAMLEALGEERDRARDDARTWIGTLGRIAAVAIGSVTALTALGMVNSRFFNVALGREAYVSEGARDWLYWGAVSSFAPAILVLMVLVGLSLVRVILRVLLRLWTRGSQIVETLPGTLRRLGLHDLETLAACALVASAAVLLGAGWFRTLRLADSAAVDQPRHLHSAHRSACLPVIPVAGELRPPRELPAGLRVGRHHHRHDVVVGAAQGRRSATAGQQCHADGGGCDPAADVVRARFPVPLALPVGARRGGLAGTALLRARRTRPRLPAVLPQPRTAAQPRGAQGCRRSPAPRHQAQSVR